MKEDLVLLCMAYPEISKTYGASVCMAGITGEGELRRIYPVPFEKFIRFGFHKREQISYEIKEKGDYRKESYKIRPETLKHGEKIDYDDVKQICKENVTTIEELKIQWNIDRTSLGIIKPELIDIIIQDRGDDVKRRKLQQQQMLDGKQIPIDLLKYNVYYKFNCGNGCDTVHRCSCLDTEVGQLYRNMKKKYDENVIVQKLRQKLFDWMRTRDLYFMMGNHSLHPRSWMIISLLYPRKEEPSNERLDKWL